MTAVAAMAGAVRQPRPAAPKQRGAENSVHDRAWWRAEARRVGSDWHGILKLHLEVIACWRARHDPDYSGTRP